MARDGTLGRPKMSTGPIATGPARPAAFPSASASLSRRAALAVMLAALILTGLCAILFQLYPAADLFITDHYTTLAHPFPDRAVAGLVVLRFLLRLFTTGGMALLALLLLAGWVRPAFRIVRPRILGFAVAVYALVPGVLVNLLLKNHWGRARPHEILRYGGTAHFTPPLQIAHECARNCSFVSGEASTLFTVATLIALILVPRLAPRSRPGAVLWCAIVAIGGSSLRILFGGHFASDVIFGALFSVVATLALYLVSGLDRDRGPLLDPHWTARFAAPKTRPAPQPDPPSPGIRDGVGLPSGNPRQGTTAEDSIPACKRGVPR